MIHQSNVIGIHFIVIDQPTIVLSGSKFEMYAILNLNATKSIGSFI